MIRTADIHDIGTIIDELLVPFHAENGLWELNMKKTMAWVTKMVEQGRVIVDERDGEITGAMGVREIELNYADKSLLNDEFFYVKMEWRGESVADGLRRKFVELAQAGNQIGILTVFNPGRMAAKGRVSDIIGFIPFGYMLRLV